MKLALFVVAAVLMTAACPALAEPDRGRPLGGEVYTLPEWFKVSFLNIKDDVAEARQQGKQLMLFLHLEECPYCAKMLKENFTGGERREYIQKHFDVIGIDIHGAAEVVWVDGKSYSERELTAHLKAFGTPGMVFFDLDGNKVLQLVGYREPRAFGQALEYVQTKRYRNESFAAFLETRTQPVVYTFRDHPQFSTTTNFKGYRKPLAVLFEDRQCAGCATFHDKVLNHPEVLPEMSKYLFVRLDTDSSKPLVDLDGKTTTAGQWAKALDLSYRPGLVLYNEGREIARADGRLYHFHFRERLRFVSGGYYKQFDSYSKYSSARREELLSQGIDIDYSE